MARSYKRDKNGQFASTGSSGGSTRSVRNKQRVAATTRANLGSPSASSVAREYGKGNPNLKSMRKTNTDRVKADNKAISSGSSRYASRGAAKIGKNKTVATSSGTVRTSPSSTAGKKRIGGDKTTGFDRNINNPFTALIRTSNRNKSKK